MDWVDDQQKLWRAGMDQDDLRRRIEDLESELTSIRSGEVVVMPISVKHAEMMHVLAERYIKDNRKAATCATCRFYEPSESGSENLFDGWCRNKVAALGATLPTNEDMSCSFHEPKGSVDHGSR